MVDAYYSTYPLEYYKEGTVYSFYVKKNTFYSIPWPGAAMASDDQVKKFSKFLVAMKDDTDQYSPAGSFSYLYRLYGVVVGKEQVEAAGKIFCRILVMFKANGQYVVKKYEVNYSGVECDGLEVLAPKAEFQYARTTAVGESTGTSGITDATNGKKGGKSGITDAKNDGNKNGTSGITDATTGEVNGASGITDASGFDDGKIPSGITEA